MATNMKATSTKILFFDFDGVILDSLPIRDFGFREIFKAFPKKAVDCLLKYHQENGGISRFFKIRYFFEKILNTPVSEDEIQNYASRFSKIMKKKLCDRSLLIQDSLQFIKKNHQKYPCHVISGSENNELNFLCQQLDINTYFRSIHGSPTPKIELVGHVLAQNHYNHNDVFYIGDSTNDYDAAIHNHIQFIGYNNLSLEKLDTLYLKSLSNLDAYLSN